MTPAAPSRRSSPLRSQWKAIIPIIGVLLLGLMAFQAIVLALNIPNGHWILIVAALTAGVMGEWVDTLAILAIVLLNAVIGFLQEERAERALMEKVRGILGRDPRAPPELKELEKEAGAPPAKLAVLDLMALVAYIPRWFPF